MGILGADGVAVSDIVYGVGWNGVTTIAPSKNAVYDKIETLGAGGASLTIAETEVFNGDAPFSYTDLDLNAVVGSNLALVLLKVKNTDATATRYQFRPDGETMETSSLHQGLTNLKDVGQNQVAWVLLYTSSSGIVEWKTAAAGRSCLVYVEAYLTV